MNVIKISPVDIANGPGCRVVVWVAGCHHNCKGCHNPNTHDFNQGTDVESKLDEIVYRLEPDYIEGLTISGGDPFAPENINGTLNLCKTVRWLFGDKKDIWVYTGYTYEELNHTDFDLIDVLVDGSFIESKKDISLLFRGSSNQRLIDIKATLKNKRVTLVKENEL